MDQHIFEAGMSRLKKLFVQTHYQRHDRLEYLVTKLQQAESPAATAAEVEDILHKIAGTAGSVGFKKLGDAAQQVEVFFRDHPTSKGSADRAAMVQVLNAFLDVSLGLCDPLEQLTPRNPDDDFDKVSGTGL
jgi:chemotaxis protein histidine kinase CheA